jgi:hypothetical protein
MQIRSMEYIYRRAYCTFASLGAWSESQRLLSCFFDWWCAGADIYYLLEYEGCQFTYEDQARAIDAIHPQRQSQELRLQTEFNMSGATIRTIRDMLEGEQAGQSTDADPSSQALSCSHPFWQACMELFETEWFSRVWTFQEQALSRKMIVTLPASLPWVLLETLLQCIRKLNINEVDDLRTATTATRHTDFLITRSMSLYQYNRRLDICSLLAITAQRRAAVPKDDVFALIGLLDADMQSLVEVDYSKDDAKVFQGFLELKIKGKPAAWLLPALWEHFAWVPTTTPGLPSWCLDLNNETNAKIDWVTCSGLMPRAVSDACLSAAQLRSSPEDGLVFLRVLELDVTCAVVQGLMGDDLPDLVRELDQDWEDIAIH